MIINLVFSLAKKREEHEKSKSSEKLQFISKDIKMAVCPSRFGPLFEDIFKGH